MEKVIEFCVVFAWLFWPLALALCDWLKSEKGGRAE